MDINGIDHLVLTVADIDIASAFYARVLNAEVRTFADGRTALHVGDQKINLHEAGAEFEPKAINPTRGSGDFCLLTKMPIAAVKEHLVTAGVEIVEGPVEKTGAQGLMNSLYIRDPDRNLVEISEYQ